MFIAGHAVCGGIAVGCRFTAEEMRLAFGNKITDLVLEVTDVARPEHGPRAVRKAMDKDHLAKSSAEGATIKLADLIDNCTNIAATHPKFARIYLREADALFDVLGHGNQQLWKRAQTTLQRARAQLREQAREAA
jgi:(p)ppGpp synthase/HD superfamily hydrolase